MADELTSEFSKPKLIYGYPDNCSREKKENK